MDTSSGSTRARSANPSSMSHNSVKAILEDRNGELWVGTEGGGLSRFERASETFVHYRHDVDDPRSIPSDRVRVLLEDSRGLFWVGTDDAGLALFDRASQSFRQVLEGELADASVKAMIEAADGTLWVGFDGDGLAHIDHTGTVLASYDPDHPQLPLPSRRVRSLLGGRCGEPLDRHLRHRPRFVARATVRSTISGTTTQMPIPCRATRSGRSTRTTPARSGSERTAASAASWKCGTASSPIATVRATSRACLTIASFRSTRTTARAVDRHLCRSRSVEPAYRDVSHLSASGGHDEPDRQLRHLLHRRTRRPHLDRHLRRWPQRAGRRHGLGSRRAQDSRSASRRTDHEPLLRRSVRAAVARHLPVGTRSSRSAERTSSSLPASAG